MLIASLVERRRIDYVDALLAELATDITEHCDLSPFLSIVTWDTGDFLWMTETMGLRFRLFDMKTLDDVQIGK